MEKKIFSRMNNPVLDQVKDLSVEETSLLEKATTRGSYVKVVLLLLALFIATGVSWSLQITPRSVLLLVFAAFAVGVFICRNPEYSRAVSPLYVVMEGTVLGQLVKIEESAYPGVALQTLIITFVIAVIIAAAYICKWINVNDVFKSRVFLVTAGIAVVYLIDLV